MIAIGDSYSTVCQQRGQTIKSNQCAHDNCDAFLMPNLTSFHSICITATQLIVAITYSKSLSLPLSFTRLKRFHKNSIHFATDIAAVYALNMCAVHAIELKKHQWIVLVSPF